MKKDHTCFVVLGPYRSGTSLTAKTLSNLGVYFGPEQELYEPSDFNPDGYFQRPDISFSNTDFIAKSGGTLRCPPHPSVLTERSMDILYNKSSLHWGFSSGKWGLKDPRFCATLSSWVDAGIIEKRILKIVHITRDIRLTAESCVKHYDVGKICNQDIEQAMQMIETYRAYAAWQIENLKVPFISVAQEDFLHNTDVTVEKIAGFVGGVSTDTIHAAIEKARTGRSIV